jgi:SecD/SecF fusion protein
LPQAQRLLLSGTYSSVFIATPVLSHWKEREPVYQARESRIRHELGAVPAYAVAMQGAPIDVAPTERRRSDEGLAASAAGPAQGVSREEFDDMVRNLGIEGEQPQPAAAGRPAGGRRARMRASGQGGAPPPPGGEAPKPKKPRNRKHGRPR